MALIYLDQVGLSKVAKKLPKTKQTYGKPKVHKVDAKPNLGLSGKCRECSWVILEPLGA